jgi:hypothetical protein
MGIEEIVAKAKEALTDERIDQVAGAVKGVTSQDVDAKVDTVAEQAKTLND